MEINVKTLNSCFNRYLSMHKRDPLSEEVLESKSIYKGRIVNLSVNKVKLSNGYIRTREIIHHSGSVAILPLLSNDNVVLVKQYRSAPGKTLLEVPAGTLEAHEVPIDCAKRELIEETGYKANKIEKMGSYYVSPGYSNEVIHHFVAKDLHKRERNLDEDENIEVVEINLKKVINMMKNGEIQDAKTTLSFTLYLNLITSFDL